jgi:outer membrane protein OmpA-like peptidoglycan-associated protein
MSAPFSLQRSRCGLQLPTGRMHIRASDRSTVSDIALYLANNSSLQVGIDGTADPRNQNLSDGRVSAVRTALMRAGVQDYRIRRGAIRSSGTTGGSRF